MEIHAHSHTERKKWTYYLWEFLMLFLAVFCGFLAENFREHQIENKREKQFARELYSEFYEDSIAIANKIKIRLDKEKDMDWLTDYFKDSSLTALPGKFYPIYTTVLYLANTYSFEPKDGVLSQLRSSGSLRYFKSVSLQKLFGDISVCINNVRYRNDQEYQYFASPVKPFILQHLDFGWLNELRKRDPNGNSLDIINNYRSGGDRVDSKILNISALNREEVSNMIMFYKQMYVSTRTLQYNNYALANHRLLDELRHNYDVK